MKIMKIKNNKVRTPNKLLYFFGYKFYFEKLVKKTYKAQINNAVLKGLKPPFIVVCNHVSPIDFSIAGATVYPYKCNYVGAVNNFIGKAWFIKQLGTLPKRQFTADLQLVRDIKYLMTKKATVLLYPEARMSADGRCSPIPTGIAKLCKMAGANLLCVNIKGAYLSRPKWNSVRRNVPIISDLSLVASKEELATLPVQEIHDRIEDALRYDDYKYQRDNNISIKTERCTNLHTLLYKCPLCGTEFTITSDETSLHCTACEQYFNMDEYGVIHNEKLPFDSVTAWYDYQRNSVLKEVQSGKYYFEDDCTIDCIYDEPHFVPLGCGKIIHNQEGFTLYVAGKVEKFASAHNFAISYDTGKCIFLSTNSASYKIMPKNKAIQCTKISLAVEQIFALTNNKI